MVYNIFIFLKCFLILCLYLFHMNSFKSVFCPHLQPLPAAVAWDCFFFVFFQSIQMIQMILDEVIGRAKPVQITSLY